MAEANEPTGSNLPVAEAIGRLVADRVSSLLTDALTLNVMGALEACYALGQMAMHVIDAMDETSLEDVSDVNLG